jgi:hypothetical protein
VLVLHQEKKWTVRNNYDDVAGARRVECGEASGESTAREHPGLIDSATEAWEA